MANGKTIGDRIFWGSAIALSLLGLIYLSVFSLVNKNLLTGILAIVFTGMWAGGLGLGFFVGKDYDILDYGTLYGNVLMFFIGFVFYVGINVFSLDVTGSLSVFSLSSTQFYSTVAAEIPANIDFIMTVFIIPIVEELLWIFGIPAALLTLMNSLKGKFKPFGFDVFANPFVQLAVVVIVGGYTFAIFHVGKVALTFFVISAIVFRSIFLISVYSDWAFDVIKKFEITPALALGAHIGNNLASFGIGKAWNLIVTYISTSGWIIIAVGSIMVLILIDGTMKKLVDRGIIPS
jgi:hypothetical protein